MQLKGIFNAFPGFINTNLEDEDEKITIDCVRYFYGGVFCCFCRCKDI